MSDIKSAKVSYILRAPTANLQAQAAWDNVLYASQTAVNEVALDFHRFMAKQARGSILFNDVPTESCSGFSLRHANVRVPMSVIGL